MGNTCCKRKKTKKKIVLLLLGLDNAGKTVAAKGLAGEPFETVVPTVGFSVINLPYRDYTVRVFDLGGGPGIRGIWPRYFVDAHGIIFVVDASDISRLDEAKEVLENVLSNDKVSGKPVLLLGNKQDQETALDEIDLVEKLNLEAIVNRYQCPTLVESCSATESMSKSKMDPGIKRGYRWILGYIHRQYEKLDQRVDVDMRQQEIIEKQLREERMARLRAIQEQEQKIIDEDAIESYSDYNRKLNGNANTRNTEDKVVDTQSNGLVIQQSFMSSESDVTSRSEESIPPIYYGNTENDLSVVDRPKSATQIIKNQLKLEQNQSRLTIKPLFTNRTSPVHLYEVKIPHSASERRKVYVKNKRNLKSAGDSVYVPYDLPNVVMDGPDGDLGREVFQLSVHNRELPHLAKNSNGVPWNHRTLNSEKEAVNVTEID